MGHIIISLNIEDETGEKIPLEELDAQMLDRVRLRLLAAANTIEKAIKDKNVQ